MRHDPIRFADAAPLGVQPDPLAVVTAMAARAPEDPLVQALLWKEVAHAGREDRARRLFEAALRSLAGDAERMAALGHALLRMGGFDEAREAFDAALALAPGDHEALLGLAALTGDAEALRRAARAAPRIEPGAAMRVRCLAATRLEVVLSPGSGWQVRHGPAHLPVERLLDGPSVYLDRDDAPLAALAQAGLLINAVADPASPALAAMNRFLARHPGVPVINRPELVARLAPEPLVAGHLDTRDVEGTYRLARAVFVDGTLYPAALLGGPDRSVRDRRAMRADQRLRDEERDFLADPQSLIGSRRWGSVRAVAARTRLDYVGVDFAPTADGIVVLGVGPAIGPAEDDPAFPYLRGSAERIARAFRTMVDARRAR